MQTEDRDNKIKKIIQETMLELLKKLQVQAELEVKRQEKKKDSSKTPEVCYQVEIKTPETGLLIGRHGETLNSLQLILGLILYKKIGSWQRVILDVGGYRKAREESLKQMVARVINEVELTKQPVTLPFLTPLERRMVHLMVAENKKFTSESKGEGKERRLTIRLR